MTKEEYQKFIENKFKVFNQESIVYDGANDISKWEEQQMKILFYYKETYGYDEFGGTSISEHFGQWIKDNIPTYKKMGLLALLLLETGKSGEIVEYDETKMKNIYTNQKLLIDAMTKISVVNIGKVSIPANETSDSIIRDKSRANKEILKSQLEILNPTIIICGGKVTADSLYADLDYLSKSNYEFDVAEIVDDKIIAPFFHLSSSACWYEKIYNYYLQIVDLMND